MRPFDRLTAWPLAAAALAAGCAAMGSSGGGGSAPVGPMTLESVTPQMRSQYIRRARVWQPVKTASLDVLVGPGGPGAFAFDEKVTCEYSPPDEPASGATPKFLCALRPDDVVKVKYGRKNGEVYAEVVATRLFWALGFGADRMYPVQVTCLNCPIEPWFFPTERRVDETTFELATIERRLNGRKIEAAGRQGWTWSEIDDVDERSGASRAERDALKLLAVFIQHSDNKAAQQRLICLPEGVGKDVAGNETCSKPFMYVQDLGLAFGEATRLNISRMDVDGWEDTPVWRDPGQCIGDLKKSFTGNLEHPRISEAGRRFLAGLLGQLSDAQIHKLFVAARVERRRSDPERNVPVEEWVRVFKAKRDAIVNHRCPA